MGLSSFTHEKGSLVNGILKQKIKVGEGINVKGYCWVKNWKVLFSIGLENMPDQITSNILENEKVKVKVLVT